MYFWLHLFVHQLIERDDGVSYFFLIFQRGLVERVRNKQKLTTNQEIDASFQHIDLSGGEHHWCIRRRLLSFAFFRGCGSRCLVEIGNWDIEVEKHRVT